MYPQRPYMGQGPRGQESRDQRDIRPPHDPRHIPPQQHDPHPTQQQLHQRPPDANTGERGASNTNPYSHFEKGGGVGTRNQTKQSPSASSSGAGGANNAAADESGKPGKSLTAASLIDAIITHQISKNVDGDRKDSMQLLNRLQASDSPRSQVVPPTAAPGPPQPGHLPPSGSRSGDPNRGHVQGQRSPPYKPHKTMGRYDPESHPGRPPISGGSITAGIPAPHYHHPSSTGSQSMSSSSSEASHSRSSSTVSPNAAALSSEALRSITLGEHIDYIILQDYNGKNPPPGARPLPPKEDGPGIPRRKSSASCLMLSSQSLPRWKQGMPSLYKIQFISFGCDCADLFCISSTSFSVYFLFFCVMKGHVCH